MIPNPSSELTFASHLRNLDWESHLERLPMAAWACCVDGSKLYLNGACRRTLGVIWGRDLQNGHWANHIKLADRERVLKSWEEFLLGSEDYFRTQLRWVKPDCGRTVHLNVCIQRLSAGWFKGWLRESEAERALSRLEGLAK